MKETDQSTFLREPLEDVSDNGKVQATYGGA